MFGSGGGEGEEPPEEFVRPPWLGPPDDELGVAVPLGMVVGRSEQGAVALSHAVAYRAGVSFEFLAQARGLTQSQTNRVFHEQHVFAAPDEELPDAFLRLGLELADGGKVSNLARKRWPQHDAEPDGPLWFPHGGGGGTGGPSTVVMRPGWWLWPLPPAGPLRVSCEWPLVGIALSSVELDAGPLRDAAARSQPLWD